MQLCSVLAASSITKAFSLSLMNVLYYSYDHVSIDSSVKLWPYKEAEEKKAGKLQFYFPLHTPPVTHCLIKLSLILGDFWF